MARKATYTMTGSEDSVTAVWAQCLGVGKYLLVRDPDSKTWARVINEKGEQIGDANQMYSDGGWAVHTRPFAGYVPPSQVEFVGESKDLFDRA